MCDNCKHLRKICLQSSLDQSDINLPRIYMQYSNNSLFFQQLVEDLGFKPVSNLHNQG